MTFREADVLSSQLISLCLKQMSSVCSKILVAPVGQALGSIKRKAHKNSQFTQEKKRTKDNFIQKLMISIMAYVPLMM